MTDPKTPDKTQTQSQSDKDQSEARQGAKADQIKDEQRERNADYREQRDDKVRIPVYETETQRLVRESKGEDEGYETDDDGNLFRTMDRPNKDDIVRVEGGGTDPSPEVSLETVNPDDRDKVLKEQREKRQDDLSDEERREHKIEAREAHSARAARDVKASESKR